MFNPLPHRAVLKSLPHNNMSDWYKSNAVADDNLNIAKNDHFFDKENSVGKGGNAGTQHFLLFPQGFPKGFLLMVVKRRDCVVMS